MFCKTRLTSVTETSNPFICFFAGIYQEAVGSHLVRQIRSAALQCVSQNNKGVSQKYLMGKLMKRGKCFGGICNTLGGILTGVQRKGSSGNGHMKN